VGRVKPFVADPDFTLYVGDVRDVLADMPGDSIDCCVTSPPYWGLRDYGTEGQIGLEPTPEAFVEQMVAVFREVRRVLSSHGTLWLNLGDSYAAKSSGGWGESHSTLRAGRLYAGDIARQEVRVAGSRHKVVAGLKPKDLVGIPWRVAFALQADGWFLRSDIIWSKPNPMPESVTDRPTKAHEYVFLLTKSSRYFFDQDAVRQPYRYDGRRVTTVEGRDGSIQHRSGERWPGIGKAQAQARHDVIARGHDESDPMEVTNAGRNVRTVWEIATQPYAEAHFATFPEALPERCIKAGTSEGGYCAECGVPRERLTAISYANPGNRSTNGPRSEERKHQEFGTAGYAQRLERRSETVGWRSTCDHDGIRRPGVVLDPFMGSGTVALVARRLGRHAVGIELNPEYAALCARRLQQLSLLADSEAAA
jgi:DNA modification methylase